MKTLDLDTLKHIAYKYIIAKNNYKEYFKDHKATTKEDFSVVELYDNLLSIIEDLGINFNVELKDIEEV